MTQKAVVIAGNIWRVKWYRRRWATNTDGICDYARREVRIFRTGDEWADTNTLVHELLHATAYELDLDETEAQVEIRATVVTEMLRWGGG